MDEGMEIRPVPPPLRPFVSSLWATSENAPSSVGAVQERMLPTGAMHLVVRLDPEPIRIIDGRGRADFPSAVVGGARTAPYLKDVTRPVPAVGAMLLPGAAECLFGVSAEALAETHTPLDALWGRGAGRLSERLADHASASARLEVFVSELTARLPRVRGLHPGVASALQAVGRGVERVGDLSSEAGMGPRRFGAIFREQVGLAPKRWLRLRRFQRVVSLAASPDVDWARTALDLGYADQPHLARDFRTFSGITLGEYRRRAPRSANHVPEISR